MRYPVLLIFLILWAPHQGAAADYIVELFEEHYKEQLVVGGGESKIYHTWQVASEFGDKLLVIVGDDHKYREWLRRSAANHRLFLVKIPDGGNDRFKYDMAVLVNVQQIHSVWEKKWKCYGCRHGAPPVRPPTETLEAGVVR